MTHVDPQARAYLDRVAEPGIPPNEELGPEAARAMTEESAGALFGPREDVGSVEEVGPRAAGGVRSRLRRPPRLTYLYCER